MIVPGGKAGPVTVDKDEHLRPDTTLEGLAKLKTFVREPGTITAGNASGVNDGAAAMLIASEAAVKKHGLDARSRASPAWRRPACRRASWASARCRRRAS